MTHEAIYIGKDMSDQYACTCGWKGSSYWDGEPWAFKEFTIHKERAEKMTTDTQFVDYIQKHGHPKKPVIMGKPFELVARTLWCEYVDTQGYPNGLPTWDEILTGKDESGVFADWYREYLHTALAVVEVIEHYYTVTPKQGGEEEGKS